jgi:hypothetical protein
MMRRVISFASYHGSNLLENSISDMVILNHPIVSSTLMSILQFKCRNQVPAPETPCFSNNPTPLVPEPHLPPISPHPPHYFPLNQSLTAPIAPPTCPFSFPGGYILPPLSTWGSQVQRSSDGMLSMTPGTWEPQPCQVVLPALINTYDA